MLLNGGADVPLAGEHPIPLVNSQPAEFKPSSQNPALEQTYEWTDFSLGMGLTIQNGDNDRRYRFARRADCSIQRQVIFGPKINTVTPSAVDSTNGISGFFEIGGALYAVNGRYVHKRTSDADWNTSRKDFGAGEAALDHVHFFTNVSGGADYIYLAMGNDANEFMQRFDGTTYTEHASLYAQAFCMQGRDLWRAHSTNTLAKVDVDSDPWTAGNWSAVNSYTVGEKGSTINRLVLNSAGVMLILKTDGIYTLDEQGEDHQLFPGMRFKIDSENGKYPYLAENWVYATYGGTHGRIDPNMEWSPIGPEQNAENNTPIAGYITAGIETQFANYAGIYNPDTGHAHLLKFGAWVFDGRESTRIDAWHGSLSDVSLVTPAGATNDGISATTATFASDKITAMHRSTIGAPSGHERLYIGTLSGKIYWLILSCRPNPKHCSSYEYYDSSDSVFTGADNATCQVYLPYAHLGFPNEEKQVRAATGTGLGLSANLSIGAYHLRTAGAAGGWTGYQGGVTTGKWCTAVPGARAVVGAVSTLLDQVVSLRRDLTEADTTTPVLTGIGISYTTHPPILLRYKPFHVLAENGLRRNDGSFIRIGADRIRTVIKAACELTAGVTVITADETSQTLVLKDYKEELLWDKGAQQFRAVLSFTGIAQDILQGDTGLHAMA